MKLRFTAGFWGAGAVIVTFLAFCGVAQDIRISAPNANPTNRTQTDSSNSMASGVMGAKTSGRNQTATAQPRGAVQEILRMIEAGVSKDVIKAYVESARLDFSPTATDLIALKEHAVPDDITTALLKRSGETQAQKAQPSQRGVIAANSDFGPLDPESYSYFQHYYLFPRTLAFAYGQLGAYYPQGFPSYYPSVPQPFGLWSGYP